MITKAEAIKLTKEGRLNNLISKQLENQIIKAANEGNEATEVVIKNEFNLAFEEIRDRVIALLKNHGFYYDVYHNGSSSIKVIISWVDEEEFL
jgi:nitrogen fixation protein